MPYVTGSAVDLTALRTAFFSACTANGWTLSGEVLHKGAVYTRVQIVSGFLALLGGTGIDGSNNLTGVAANVARIGRPSTGMPDISWPISYEIFVLTDPDEVYLVCNYNIDCYLWAAFGQSTIGGLSGTGAWFAASLNASPMATEAPFFSLPDSGSSYGGIYLCPGLFWGTSEAINAFNSMIHHGLDGDGWSTVVGRSASAIAASGKMIAALPNAWNSESVLVPIQVWQPRLSGNKVSLVADIAHARHLRIDNHVPGEIITLGSDGWKVFPLFRKNSGVRNAGAYLDHTGTLGFAVRYDGS